MTGLRLEICNHIDFITGCNGKSFGQAGVLLATISTVTGLHPNVADTSHLVMYE